MPQASALDLQRSAIPAVGPDAKLDETEKAKRQIEDSFKSDGPPDNFR
jgi:hypothetical protein